MRHRCSSGLESELLKSVSVRQCSQSWNGSYEKCLKASDLCYKLPSVKSPDWGATFEEWADVSQNFFVS